jgi:putative LysE/RhtB family amino acid efflux pump
VARARERVDPRRDRREDAGIGWQARLGLESAEDVVAPRRAFLTAVAATALNPLTIALWTVSFPAAAPARSTSSTATAAALLLGVALGTLTWYGGFSVGVVLVRRRAGPRSLGLIDVVSGALLVGFGALHGYRAVREHQT